jgi:hypothetical protein
MAQQPSFKNRWFILVRHVVEEVSVSLAEVEIDICAVSTKLVGNTQQWCFDRRLSLRRLSFSRAEIV